MAKRKSNKSDAIRQYLANPILGVGAGNFSWNLGEFQGDELLAKYDQNLSGSVVAHSLYFELLADLGSTGVAVFITLVWLSFRNLIRL